MATMTIKNVPEDVHIALKQRAKRHKRSLNQEAIVCLDLALGRRLRDPQAILDGIRNLHSRISVKQVSLDWIDSAKRPWTPMIVADTSLIASLLIPGPATPTALAVLERDPNWTAPALWRYEFKNVLATQMRVLGLPADQAVALFEMALLIIAEPEIEVEPEAILRVAHAKKLSAYDAEFLALAHALDLQIVTFDKGILKADPEAALSPDAFASV